MRNIEKIKIGAAGEQLPHDATNHVAVLLPAFGLMFTRSVINPDDSKSQDALELACKAVNCAGFSDWDMPEIEELELLAKELGETTKPDGGRDPWVPYLTRLQLAASVFNTVCYRVEARAKATRVERRLSEIGR